MTNSQQKTKQLIDKYLAGNATPDEVKKLERAYYQAAARMNPTTEEMPDEIDRIGMESWIALMRLIEQKPARKIALWPRIAAAASILLFLSAGAYFVLKPKKPIQQIAILKPGTFKNDVLPGKNNAYITLSNGRRVILSSATVGSLAQQGNTNIQKMKDGQVVYQAGEKNAELVYNTLVVPRGGGKRELRLADGTLAILDAGSSIRFPVAFTGKDRRVSITGQVYFEVVHNDKQPFFVTAKGQTIEDVGTHFNVNAFDDEPVMKTTLLEGSIKFNDKLLKPGEQAVVSSTGQMTIRNSIDVNEVTAWINDRFEFEESDGLQAEMRQVARWYDLQVTYQGNKKQYHFGGDMLRNTKLSDVLRILESNGLQFSIDGNKLIVYQ